MIQGLSLGLHLYQCSFILFQSTSSAAVVASGEDGDLSSDHEPPARPRKSKTKKSPSNKPKTAGFLNLNFSDDSDFEIHPTKASKGAKEKKSKRRSLLPPVMLSDTVDPNECNDYFLEYMDNLRTKNHGRFFPSLPGACATPPDTKKATAMADQSCIVVSDDEVPNEVDKRKNKASTSSTSQPDMDTDTTMAHSGARPKTKLVVPRPKHSYVDSSSDSDSLLSPPKKSKASHLADEKKLARKNRMRVEVDLSPETSSPTPRQLIPASSATFTVKSASPQSDPVAVSPHVQSPMNTDNDSSDIDEAKWEQAILDMSRPYIDLSKKSTPPRREKKKARRRSTATVQQDRTRVIPDVIITEDSESNSQSQTQNVQGFNFAPSIAFTPADRAISFTGQRSEDTNNNDKSTENHRHPWQTSDRQSSEAGPGASTSGVGASTSSDSPLANMIVDMAIQDVDFDTEMTQPPRPSAPRPFTGFQPASSLMSRSKPGQFFPPFSSDAFTQGQGTHISFNRNRRQTSPRKSFSPRQSLSSRQSLSPRHSSHIQRRLSHRVSPHFPDDDDDDLLLLGAEGGAEQSDDVVVTRMEQGRGDLTGTRDQEESDAAMARRLQVN